MKALLAIAILTFSFSSMASFGPFKDVADDVCPGAKMINKGSTLLCAEIDNANLVSTVSRAYAEKLITLPKHVQFLDAIELGVWPDDSTSMIYMYSSKLVEITGKPLGYVVIHGYVNSEMEAKIQLETRYNLKGELVSITLK